MVTFKEDTNYTYAVARVRALEARLLDDKDFFALIESDVGEMQRMLAGFGYDELATVYRSGGKEKLENALLKFYRSHAAQVKELSLDGFATSIFDFEFDFFNLKRYLRNKHFTPALGYYYARLGSVPAERMEEYLEKEGVENVPEPLNPYFAELDGEIASRESVSIFEVDTLVEKNYLKMLASVGRQTEIVFIQELARLMADMYNFTLLFRSYLQEKREEALRNAWAEGGVLPVERFVSARRKSAEQAASSFLGTAYDSFVKKILEKKRSVDVLVDDEIMGHMRQAKGIVFGIEPLVAYIYAAYSEMDNIRMVLLGRKMGLPAEELKKRLRASYV